MRIFTTHLHKIQGYSTTGIQSVYMFSTIHTHTLYVTNSSKRCFFLSSVCMVSGLRGVTLNTFLVFLWSVSYVSAWRRRDKTNTIGIPAVYKPYTAEYEQYTASIYQLSNSMSYHTAARPPQHAAGHAPLQSLHSSPLGWTAPPGTP